MPPRAETGGRARPARRAARPRMPPDPPTHATGRRRPGSAGRPSPRHPGSAYDGRPGRAANGSPRGSAGPARRPCRRCQRQPPVPRGRRAGSHRRACPCRRRSRDTPWPSSSRSAGGSRSSWADWLPPPDDGLAHAHGNTRRSMERRFGTAHAPSPDVRFGHPADPVRRGTCRAFPCGNKIASCWAWGRIGQVQNVSPREGSMSRAKQDWRPALHDPCSACLHTPARGPRAVPHGLVDRTSHRYLRRNKPPAETGKR